MVKTRRMILTSEKSVKPKSEKITHKKSTKENSQNLKKSLKVKSDKITKEKNIEQITENPGTSIDELLKLCKPCTIRLNRVLHIPTQESKFEKNIVIDGNHLFL